MRYNFSDKIIFDRDTSRPKDKLKYRRRLIPEINEPKKFSKLKFNSKFNINHKNINNNNNINNNLSNSEENKLKDIENGANKENESKLLNSIDINEQKDQNSNNNNKNENNFNDIDINNITNNNNNKETQNAFVQVNFLDEIIENERQKIIEQYKEKENEMQLKINDLMQNLQLIKFENQKEIIDLKNQLNEKKEEIINHENLKNKLKMQLEKETSKIDELNNQINDLKEKNRILSEENTKIKDNIDSINEKNRILSEENTKIKNNIDSTNINNRSILDFSTNKIEDKSVPNNNRYNNEEESSDIIKYSKKDPTIVKLNRSVNIKNKNGAKSLLLIKSGNNNFFYKNKNSNKSINEPNMSINFLMKSNKNNGNQSLRKTQNDYSIQVYNNIFPKGNNNKTKRRAISARILNLRDTSIENNKSNLSKIFNDSEKRALSTLFDTQEDFNNFNKKMSALDNNHNSLVRKLILENKLLTKENENKKEELLFLQEKLKQSENKLRNVNTQLNYEKYILNKTKKSFRGSKAFNEEKKK